MADALREVVDGWREPGLAWCEEWHWHMLCWADNLWVVADSWEKMERRISDITEALYAAGMRWSPSSLEVMANPVAQGRRSLFAKGMPVQERKWLNVLGIRLDEKGSTRSSWRFG